MNAIFCWKENALFAVILNDTVNAISDVIETPYFQNRLILVIYVNGHFRNASADDANLGEVSFIGCMRTKYCVNN
jgi:hypothetical protein